MALAQDIVVSYVNTGIITIGSGVVVVAVWFCIVPMIVFFMVRTEVVFIDSLYLSCWS